jgi:nucleotide-binding universal stress UspA family protein
MATVFRKILVPYDFSRSAGRALRTAVDLARTHEGALQVLHVIPPLYPLHGRPIVPSATDLAETRRRLDAVVARAVKGRRVPRVRTSVVVGSPAPCILAAAAKADAIVMGTLGRTGLPHLLIGSVAERVVRHATVPVLTVRARPTRAR